MRVPFKNVSETSLGQFKLHYVCDLGQIFFPLLFAFSVRAQKSIYIHTKFSLLRMAKTLNYSKNLSFIFHENVQCLYNSPILVMICKSTSFKAEIHV